MVICMHLLLFFLLTCVALFGEDPPQLTEEVVTHHKIVINGQEIAYQATAGLMPLRDDKGVVKANFFYVAYVKEGMNPEMRPISFCFNGGPGSASVWLHLGILGPKRLEIQDLTFGAPPYRLRENPLSILDLTDLVFIDPIATGYSRPAVGEDAKQFFGVDEDVKAVGEFIRLYTTRQDRWASPKFLIGESYGTLRAVALAHHLQAELRYTVNGLVLLSTLLNFATLDDADPGNDLAFSLYLPSFAATAWYHQKLDASLQKDLSATIKEAQEFALGDYADVLFKGDLASPEKRQEAIDKLHHYTSLSKDYITQNNLRICQTSFCKELLKKDQLIVGRFDGRFTGPDLRNCGQIATYDPSLDALLGEFTGAFNTYVRDDLKWVKDEQYKVLTNVEPWNFGNNCKNCNVSDTFATLLTKNPALRVYIASGYFDLATPFLGAIYTVSHLGLRQELKDHIQMVFFEAGHMMYIHPPSAEKFKKEITDFYHNTLR